MLETVLLDKALCLPADDISALLSGKLIAALPRVPVQKGWSFALYPYVEATAENFYRSNCVTLTNTSTSQASTIEAWATCEQCMMLHSLEEVEALSCSTVWQKEALKSALEQRQHLFLVFLRVYQVPIPFQVDCEDVNADKFGKFISLASIAKGWSPKISEKLPVLGDRIFAQRKRQLENLEPPEHPELETLHSTIAQLTPTNPNAIHLEQDLKCFLGWAESAIVDRLNPDQAWIHEIAQVGNSSDGDLFEKLVRKSFIDLGFTNSRNNPKMSLDPEITGGAGGIDFFCDAPYLVIGECKASKDKKVNDNKDGAPAQLIKHGNAYLQPEEFENCIRIIMAPGELTDYAKRTASGNRMNVLQPETLQRLIELRNVN